LNRHFLLFFAALSLLLSASCSNGPGAAEAHGPAPAAETVAVRVVKASSADVPFEIKAVGNVEAFSTVAIKSQVAGEMKKVAFMEGQEVSQGQTLFEIDKEPLLEQIRRLEATLAKDIALEKQAEANLRRDESQAQLSRDQAARSEKLLKEGISSREQNDTVASAARSADLTLAADRASIESAKATIGEDQSRLSEARRQLGYATIKSPISGKAGAISVKAGNLVKDNDTVLVTILQTRPIYVAFGVPEQDLPSIVLAHKRQPLHVEAAPTGGTAATGVLAFIDSAVDNTTGTVKLKGVFPNTDSSLWPGEFVNATIRLRTEPNRVLVPTRAIQTGPEGSYVWVVKAGGTVERRDVSIARARGEQSVIASGLASGETVVSEGQMRLDSGARVRILAPGTQTQGGGAGTL
jgi:multidrug efflux system membrane fusion protein